METKPPTHSLLEQVAPDAWPKPVQPPTRDAPDPLQTLRDRLRVSLARDLALIHMDAETGTAVIEAVMVAVRLALSPNVSLADATAVALIAERVTLAVTLALEDTSGEAEAQARADAEADADAHAEAEAAEAAHAAYLAQAMDASLRAMRLKRHD